jgi:hypothetical protein
LRTVTDWHAPIADRNSLAAQSTLQDAVVAGAQVALCKRSACRLAVSRDMMEARHREFVLQCHSNADLPTPLSLADIAAQVNGIDFSTSTSVALTRSSSALDDADEPTVEFAASGRRRASSVGKPAAAAAAATVDAVGEPPTLLQRAVKLAAGVDFGEWRVVWSTKFQRPFYFNARNGIGVFDKPHEVPIDVYALAVEQHRAAEGDADASAPPPTNHDDDAENDSQ